MSAQLTDSTNRPGIATPASLQQPPPQSEQQLPSQQSSHPQGTSQTRSGVQIRSWQPQEAKRAKVEAGGATDSDVPLKQEDRGGSLPTGLQAHPGVPVKSEASNAAAATPSSGGLTNGIASRPADFVASRAGGSMPLASQSGMSQPGMLPMGSMAMQPSTSAGQPVISLPPSHPGGGGAGYPSVANYNPASYAPPHSQPAASYPQGVMGQPPYGAQPRPPGGVNPTGAGGAGAGQPQRQASGSDMGEAGDGKQVSTGDIQRVQNYIEKCLQMYLTQKEVVGQLQQQFKIEPCFTQLVWQKLEEQNQEFFKAYYTRLKLKDQIVLFNHLLDEQVKMFGRMPHGGHIMPGAHMLQQTYPGAAPRFSQQNPQGAPTMVSGAMMGSQPLPLASNGSQPMSDAGFAPASAPDGVVPGDPPEADQMIGGDFPGLDGEVVGDPDLALAQSMAFSASEMNLANMVSMGSIGRGLNHHDQELGALSRNFSLSDLALDHADPDPHSLMQRDISLSDFQIPLDLDSGGEQG